MLLRSRLTMFLKNAVDGSQTLESERWVDFGSHPRNILAYVVQIEPAACRIRCKVLIHLQLRLNDLRNYHAWKIRIQHVLTLKGLKKFILHDPPPRSDDNHAELDI